MLSRASRWATRSNIAICNTTTKRVGGDGAAFVPGANAISYVPRVDWDGSWLCLNVNFSNQSVGIE